MDDYNPSQPAAVLWLSVPEHFAGQRLDHVLQQLLPDYSRSRLQTWIKDGLVRVDGNTRQPKDKVWGRESVEVMPQLDQEQSAFVPDDVPLDIVFEDDTLLVINKPAGLVVHPGSGNWRGTLLNGLLFHRPASQHLPRAGIVHRLDKETSGLMVVAKTALAQTALVRQLQDKSVRREYLAVVNGLLRDDGSVDAPIGRHPGERTHMAVHPLGKPAVTHYEIEGWFRGHTLVRCRLETGRTHQIRVHMQSIGHPLAADPVYGGRPRVTSPILNTALLEFGRQALHAETLGLLHPGSGEHLSWTVAMPADMQRLIQALTEDFFANASPEQLAAARGARD